MTGGAFLGNLALRDELLADLSGETQRVGGWLTPGTSGPDAAVGAAMGFHPAFTALASELAQGLRSDDDRAFAKTLLGAIAPGEDTADLVRRWFLQSWDAAPVAIRDGLVGQEPLAAAAAVAELVAASRESPVAGKVWRSARAALGRIVDVDPQTSDYLQVPLAFAFDLDLVPGAVADAISAWSAAIRGASNRVTGWTDDIAAEAGGLNQSFYERAAEKVQGITDREEAVRQVTTLVQQYFSESPRAQELTAFHKECWEASEKRRNAWLASARQTLIALSECDSGRVG